MPFTKVSLLASRDIVSAYRPPVHGSSTRATSEPRIIAPGIDAFLTYF